MFSFSESRFQVQKSKEGTARVSLWKEYKIPNVFTLEASFLGYDTAEGTVHYTQADYINIGKYTCRALHTYIYQFKLGFTDLVHGPSNLELENLKQTLSNELNLLTGENPCDSDFDSGSDSDPSEDDLPDEQFVKLTGAKKKKSTKSGSSSPVKRDKVPVSASNSLNMKEKERPKTSSPVKIVAQSKTQASLNSSEKSAINAKAILSKVFKTEVSPQKSERQKCKPEKTNFKMSSLLLKFEPPSVNHSAQGEGKPADTLPRKSETRGQNKIQSKSVLTETFAAMKRERSFDNLQKVPLINYNKISENTTSFQLCKDLVFAQKSAIQAVKLESSIKNPEAKLATDLDSSRTHYPFSISRLNTERGTNVQEDRSNFRNESIGLMGKIVKMICLSIYYICRGPLRR